MRKVRESTVRGELKVFHGEDKDQLKKDSISLISLFFRASRVSQLTSIAADINFFLTAYDLAT